MSEQELREAAAAGAAAAVDAVASEQDERERAAGVEQAAAVAAEQATIAVQTTEAVAEVAVEASQEAAVAADTAAAAADTAEEAKSEAQQLREFVAAGFGELRNFITSRLPEPEAPKDEPTEVVVTHASDSGPNPATEERSDEASGTSAPSERARSRHKFGRRIP